MATTIPPAKFAELLQKIRERKAAEELLKQSPPSGDGFTDSLASLSSKKTMDDLIKTEQGNQSSTDKYGNAITYNDKQQEFINLASTHKSCVLVGPAGTGKTTCMKGAISALAQSPHTRILDNHDHKHLPMGVPGVIICAFTRRATNNIRRNMDEGMKANCITIHKLLEYGPVYYEETDADGNDKKTMRFEPARNSYNPLPSGISTIAFEESSMVGVPLYQEVISALPQEVQIIFLGDIQQLPPVFGSAILGFKMLELPVVELTEVYRQALESPIIRLAHRILSGKPILEPELIDWNVPDQLTIKPWKKKIDADAALNVSEQLFDKLYEHGGYNPESDMILIPFNKSYGTLELNKSIANHIARKKAIVTWEVVSGFIKHYFSVGDKVLYDREDAIILDIIPNPSYTGSAAQPESIYLDYWGHNNTPKGASKSDQDEGGSEGTDIDFLLTQVAASEEDRVTQSSHQIRLLMQDSETEKTVTKASEINAMILGYALTVHKSQGSEFCSGLIFSNSPIGGTIPHPKDIEHATNPSPLHPRVQTRSRQKNRSAAMQHHPALSRTEPWRNCRPRLGCPVQSRTQRSARHRSATDPRPATHPPT